jgi:2-dehydropantoate 2-reductase
MHLSRVTVTDDPKTIGPVDLVMFCVKLWDTEAAARQLMPIVGPETGVISFQNGVQKDDMLRPIFGDKALMGGVAYVGTAIGRPGVIVQTGQLQRLVFGEYDGRRSQRAETFLAACKAGGINAELSDDVRRSLWEKFVVLVALPADYAEQRMAFFDGWPPDMTASMHHDLQAGKPLELRWLSGGVVDLGKQVGVPTPMNRAVRDILTLHAGGADAKPH